MDTGYYPARAELVRHPLTYLSGGEVVGRVLSVQMGAVVNSHEDLTEHNYGGDLVDTRMIQQAASYSVRLADANPKTYDMLFNKMSSGNEYGNNLGYNLGDILPPDKLHSILVRPLDDDGNVDVNKPFYHLPRCYASQSNAFVWNEDQEHGNGWIVNLVAMKFEDGKPVVEYGDVRGFTHLDQGDEEPEEPAS